MTNSNNSLLNPLDPNCLRCLRLKLKALAVGVFFKEGDNWRLGSFEGDKPSCAAEVEFDSLIKLGVPALVANHPAGLILNDNAAIAAMFPTAQGLFQDQAVIAAPIHFEQLSGIRIAWRSAATPFQKTELETLLCFSQCPPGCEPR